MVRLYADLAPFSEERLQSLMTKGLYHNADCILLINTYQPKWRQQQFVKSPGLNLLPPPRVIHLDHMGQHGSPRRYAPRGDEGVSLRGPFSSLRAQRGNP